MSCPESYVILHNVSKKHNVGTISRCATAFNVTQICLVGSNRFNAFGSHGSDAHVDFGWHASIEACCQELREEKGAQIVGVEIMPSALPVHSFPFRGPTAFMLGNEGQGLSERQIRNCDAFIYIPQYGAGTASLNVAVAASIVLHHFALWAGFPERGREGQKFIVAPRPQSARGKGAFDYLEDRLSILVAWEDRMQNAFAILSGDQPDTATSKSRKNRKKAVQTAPAEPRVFKPAEEVFAVSDDFMQVRGRSQGKGRAESGIKAGGRMPTTAELETAAASADPSTRPALISDWLSQISSPNASAAQTFKEALAGGTALDALLASFLASPGSEAEADALARLVAAAAHETCPPGVPSSLVAMLRALGALHASDPLGGLPAAPRALAALCTLLRQGDGLGSHTRATASDAPAALAAHERELAAAEAAALRAADPRAAAASWAAAVEAAERGVGLAAAIAGPASLYSGRRSAATAPLRALRDALDARRADLEAARGAGFSTLFPLSRLTLSSSTHRQSGAANAVSVAARLTPVLEQGLASVAELRQTLERPGTAASPSPGARAVLAAAAELRLSERYVAALSSLLDLRARGAAEARAKAADLRRRAALAARQVEQLGRLGRDARRARESRDRLEASLRAVHDGARASAGEVRGCVAAFVSHTTALAGVGGAGERDRASAPRFLALAAEVEAAFAAIEAGEPEPAGPASAGSDGAGSGGGTPGSGGAAPLGSVDTLRRQLAEVQARLAAREGALAAAGVATGGSEGLGGAPGAQPDGHGHATRDAGRADPLPNGGHEAVPGSVQEETAGGDSAAPGEARAEEPEPRRPGASGLSWSQLAATAAPRRGN
ncbi:tRNA (guanosine(18)-2'-O)-methyltransferase [Auxenochlorella protothecoides]|uniref:tRNA (Guanosine(18)-2'-O)-methyltransferase n=2 Tax=Auxenochlorella protothecoides TaxID=3075 RepID=A0A087SPW3_AUXPR|nr:tRNA (guanosine(18)-2'-O)-methyltransferase [Auxenochlorella protothecoides]KFM27767.1 tRNA (guanosine(18)-2'-O)-methyltransferase [Auxenochlorella protothecoides]